MTSENRGFPSEAEEVLLSRRRALALGALGLAGGLTAPAAAFDALWRPESLTGLRLHSNPASAKNQKTIVSIFLRGGADALNVIVPWSDPEYYKLRPGIGIPEKATADAEAVWKLDERFGLHPALRALEDLWKKKMLAPVVCTGSNHPTRSHFDAQDFMEYAAPGSRTLKEGWLNRYLGLGDSKQSTKRLRGLAMQRLLPRALRGQVPVLAVSSRKRRDEDDLLDVFDDLYGAGETDMAGMSSRKDDSGAVAVGRETIKALRELQAAMEKKGSVEGGVKYPRTGLARRLARLANVIRADAGLEVAALDLGGWDTHANQGGSRGSMGRRLAELGDGLAAFTKDLGDEAMKNVLVLVMTEFGRTCRENGNLGTDHGHGGFVLALGGAVDGGKVHGDWPGLDDKKLYQGRDLRVTTDFRDIFHQSLCDFGGAKLPKNFFPDFKPSRKAPKILA